MKNKSVILIIVAICIIVLGCVFLFNKDNNPKYAPAPTQKGDVNNDNVVDSSDYILLRKYVMGETKFDDSQKKKGDINSDGVINSQDYIILKKQIFGE